MSHYQLARAWAAKGRIQHAISSCRRALDLAPDSHEAWRLLAELLLMDNQPDQCAEICSRYPPDHSDFGLLRDFCDEVLLDRGLSDQPGGRIRMFLQKRFSSHRSGWGYALEALKPLHHQGGALLDGFMENSFVWSRYVGKPWANRIPPYRQPWVGFIHNPPGSPAWYPFPASSPQEMLALPSLQESLECCHGFYTLSETLAEWLRGQTGKPVQSLLLPTEFPELQFSPERFLSNPSPKIVQIGWWLRRLISIFQLPVYSGYRKVWLVTPGPAGMKRVYQDILELEGRLDWTNVEQVEALSKPDYDECLSENLAFVHLYDASANNAVVECIARATPLLVNRLPAVVEYLGEDYPLYFDSLDHAAQLAADCELVLQAHQYLKTCPSRSRLTGLAFRRELEAGAIYQGLPSPEA